MSLNELIAQRDELARQQTKLAKAIAEAKNEMRKSVTNEIQHLMSENGLTVEDLASSVRSSTCGTGTEHGNSGNKVAPKYRNPARCNLDWTWT